MSFPDTYRALCRYGWHSPGDYKEKTQFAGVVWDNAALRRRRPKLVFRDAWTRTSRIPLWVTEDAMQNGVILHTRDRNTGESLRVISVGVANAPNERHPEAILGSAVVEVEFKGQNQTLTVRGRWSANDYPRAMSAPGQSSDLLRRRDLQPNGEIHGVHIAYLLGDKLYAASHDFWIGTPDDAEWSLLTESEYAVLLRIAGTGRRPQTHDYRFRRIEGDPPFEMSHTK